MMVKHEVGRSRPIATGVVGDGRGTIGVSFGHFREFWLGRLWTRRRQTDRLRLVERWGSRMCIYYRGSDSDLTLVASPPRYKASVTHPVKRLFHIEKDSSCRFTTVEARDDLVGDSQ
ncbi:hypothetical protein TNCV_3039941 [Trichonephila clavipes]|uniref:Uncharacterized protein n=1 Tax=Trichonephila clavipes TaxID=2585209 RepID=A0A8X6RV89_TRICX|nr:hypothetical protein TNCV_3039941 [Trichonephila clavipes]